MEDIIIMKDKIFGVLQRVGRSFMLPIALLPVAGLLLGIGSSFTNATTIETYHLGKFIYEGGVLYTILDIMSKTGSAVFDNLALLFAMGVAIGMAKKEKEVAALSGAIAYIVMNTTISALITAKGGVEAMAENSTTSVLGITTLQMGVFGGILVGLGVAALHNKFYKTELPQVLSFFGGTRFVPIVSTVTYLIVGIIMFYLWPIVQLGISKLGVLVLNSGYAGTWIYGILERALIPFGLHHVFYMPFWQTELGGSMMIDGNMVAGAQNIFFAELASKSTEVFSVSATRFMAGKFPFMIFGLPAAAFAMYKTARPEKKKIVGSLLLSAALTSMITGITEPLEFTFLFVAPLMYAVHCVLAGLSYMLMHILNVGVGMTFSGGLIDMTLFGILQGNEKTHWIWIVVVGLIYAVVYYFVFYFMITKMNLKTPGREPDDVEPKLYRRSDVNEAKAAKVKSADKRASDVVSAMILKGLGGKDNLSDVDCCATRLRCTVHKAECVDDALLKSTGASGVVHKGNGVQIIYGPRVSVIKSNLEDYLETAPDEEFTAGGNDVDATAHVGVDTNVDGGANAGVAENANTSSAEATVVETIVISSPITGLAADLSTTPDEAFAGKMMGDGAVVTPEDSVVRAPEDGEVCFVFETKHAIGFLTDSGVSLLIHMGIDTVALNGEGFEVFVENGQKVKKGEPLLSLNLDYLKENAPSLASPVLCTELEDNQKVRLLKDGQIKAGEALFAIDIYE